MLEEVRKVVQAVPSWQQLHLPHCRIHPSQSCLRGDTLFERGGTCPCRPSMMGRRIFTGLHSSDHLH